MGRIKNNRIRARLITEQKGVVLPLALILLALGSLILMPLLNLTTTNLKGQLVYNARLKELYAADSGIEDALFKVRKTYSVIPALPSDPALIYGVGEMNERSVTDTVERIDELTLKITSAATGLSSGTSIESYVSIYDFNVFTDNAITSPTSVIIQPSSTISGDVQCPPASLDNKGTITGDIIADQVQGWPDTTLLTDFYMDQVDDLTPSEEAIIDIFEDRTIGPVFRDGNLTIKCSKANKTLRVLGTVYVTGNLIFQQPGNKDYILDLNGNTIFVEGYITFPSSSIQVRGPGAIIALGDVIFQPSILGTGFIYVMSVEGMVNFQPSGTFTGSVAGNDLVNIQPSSNLTRPAGVVPTLNLPGQNDQTVISSIHTWTIRQQ